MEKGFERGRIPYLLHAKILIDEIMKQRARGVSSQVQLTTNKISNVATDNKVTIHYLSVILRFMV